MERRGACVVVKRRTLRWVEGRWPCMRNPLGRRRQSKTTGEATTDALGSSTTAAFTTCRHEKGDERVGKALRRSTYRCLSVSNESCTAAARCEPAEDSCVLRRRWCTDGVPLGRR